MNRASYLTPSLFIVILCLLLYLPGILYLPVTDRDEALFSQASKQMVESNNYAAINFQDKPRHLKPPGIYWLQATSAKVFSGGQLNQIWTYRLPSLLGAMLSALLLFGFLANMVGRKYALLAASLLASCVLLSVEGHLATTDAMLLAAMVLMQGGLLRAFMTYKQQQPAQAWWLVCFWGGMTLGLVIKGTSPLIGFVTLFSVCALERSWQFWRACKPLIGVSLTVIITLIWLIIFSWAGHGNFLWDMIHGDVLPKLAGGQQSHGAPPGTFLLIYPLMFWPTSIFTVLAIHYAWQQRKQALSRFLLAWLIPNWLIFALIPTKLPQYMLPMYPAIACFIVLALSNRQTLSGSWKVVFWLFTIIWSLCTLAIAIAPSIFSWHLLHTIGWHNVIFAVVIISLLLLALLAIKRQHYQRLAWGLVFSAILVFNFIYCLLLPQLSPVWLSHSIKTAIPVTAQQAITDKQPLLATDYQEPSLVFLLGSKRVKFSSVDGIANRLKQQSPRYALLSQPSYQRMLAKNPSLHKLSIIARIRGFHYNGGHWLTLYLVSNQQP